jgi:hypothetical protein
MTFSKTIMAGQYRVTIKLCESKEALKKEIEALITSGYKSASSRAGELFTDGYKSTDEVAQAKTYHLCFNDSGVMYYDLI